MEKISVLKEKWLKNEIANLKAEGISKAEIAYRLNVKPQYLNNVLNGGRGITDAFLDKFFEEFNITHFDLFRNQVTDFSEQPVIYKSDPKDAEIIAAKQMIIERDAELIVSLRSKIKELEAQLYDHSAGLHSAPAADTPSVGGCQTSAK